MDMLTNEEELKCDGDGYFDLDAIKPYSSVWVSPKNTLKRCQISDKDSDIPMTVSITKPCSDLHSLLDSVNRSIGNKDPNEEKREQEREEIKICLSSTKHEQLHNGTNQVNDTECTGLKKMSDSIIESMCKQIYDTDSNSGVDSKCSEHTGNGDSPPETSTDELKVTKQISNDMLNEESNGLTVSEAMLEKARSLAQQKDKDIVICSTTNSQASFADNGKLQTELKLSEIDVKDQNGRDYHLVVKYVWETNFEQLTNGALAVLDVSPSFVELVNRLSPSELKNKVECSKKLTPERSNAKCVAPGKKETAELKILEKKPITIVPATPEKRNGVKKIETPVGKGLEAKDKKAAFRRRVSSVSSTQHDRTENNQRPGRVSISRKAAGTDDEHHHASYKASPFKKDERRPPTAPLDTTHKTFAAQNRFLRKGFKGKFAQMKSVSPNGQDNYRK